VIDIDAAHSDMALAKLAEGAGHHPQPGFVLDHAR
jgi:hypothetical protein